MIERHVKNNRDEKRYEIPSDIYHDLIESIVAAMEARDALTSDHSRRVSDMAERFFPFLNMTESEFEPIHMAAHVHDIGKIGIPDSILLSQKHLSSEDWKLMEQHPKIGAAILSKSPCLREIAELVLHHHERWDGLGYPDGQKEDVIPYGSRIIALCDSVDAMLSVRAYRRPLTQAQCRQELLENCGRMYDPHLTRHFLLHWNAIVKQDGSSVFTCGTSNCFVTPVCGSSADI